MSYTDDNARTIDRWVEEGWEWGKPISHEEFLAAKRGEWNMLLTPTKPVPKSWFGEIRGKRILGLASGGAQQMPVFAALGAECFVLDYSPRQIESERMTAEREGYTIHAVCSDMTQPLPFPDDFFDLIFHPVSNCYIEDVMPVWRECHRVLKRGGRLLAGLDNGLNFLVDEEKSGGCVTGFLPFNPLIHPEQKAELDAQDCGWQFSHTIEEQIGGQLKAGFRLLDVYGDTNSEGILRDHGADSFWATLSEKET